MHQQLERLRREIVHRFIVLTCELVQKLLRQQRNVTRPAAQRRQIDFHHAQPEKQVLAEFSGFDEFFQVFVRGSNKPQVRRQSFIRADAFEGPLAGEMV